MSNTKVLNHHFGDVKYGTKTLSVFSLPEELKNIDYIHVDCFCTDFIIDEDKITFTIDTTQLGAEEGEYKSIHKSPTLLLDPNVKEFIADERLKRIPNPDKKRVVFVLTGGVQ